MAEDTPPSTCPYTVGSEILLQLQDEKRTPIKARVLKFFTSTLSCVMVIRFLEPCPFQDAEECVVKLYDRRFSTQLREDEGAELWSEDLERKHQKFIRDGDAAEFFSYWEAESARDSDWDGCWVRNRERWSEAKVEAYLQFWCHRTHDLEMKAYDLLQDIQGQHVPRMLGSVSLETVQRCGTNDLDNNAPDDTDPGNNHLESDAPNDTALDSHVPGDTETDTSDQSDDDFGFPEVDKRKLTSCPGLLLQYIRGFPLTDAASNLLPEQRQSVCDDAINVLHQIMNRGICNRDVNTRSFMVQEGTHKAFMMDFGLIWLREVMGSDDQFHRCQANMDEEGAVGMVMQSKLRKEGGGFVYTRSEWALRLSYRFNHHMGEREGGTEEEEEYVKQYLGVPTDVPRKPKAAGGEKQELPRLEKVDEQAEADH